MNLTTNLRADHDLSETFAPSDADRAFAAESSPFADDWHAVDEQTPVEALDEPTDHDDDQAEDGPGHYTTVCDRFGRVISTDRPRYEARELETCWIVWDCMEQEIVGRFDSARDARDEAEDRNIEDYEPLLVGTLPWFETPYPVAEWDGPRFSPRFQERATSQANQVTTPTSVPGDEWDDCSEATVTVEGQCFDVRVYDEPAPGRIPAGAMLGKPLFVSVIPANTRG